MHGDRQLGHNDRVNKLTPTKVMALAAISITQITCGWSHTAALDDVGQVYTWGNSDHGKLGHADLARKVAVPHVVETLKHYRVVKVASYNEHTAALVEPNYNYFAGDGSALSTPSGAGGNGGVSPLICNAVPVTAMYKAQLKAMINDEEFSDVTFLLDDQPVYAHKAILAQRCEHFAAMFRR
jgi:RCC1 and BTB domain-containing protein